MLCMLRVQCFSGKTADIADHHNNLSVLSRSYQASTIPRLALALGSDMHEQDMHARCLLQESETAV